MPHFKPNQDDTVHAAEDGREILFEVTYVGNLVRVTAVDAETGIEATIVGLPTMTQYSLRMNAVRKLARVMARNDGASDENDESELASNPRPNGRYYA